MVHELEVPLPQPGLEIDADEGVAKQIVPRPRSAVEVRRGILDRQVDQAEILIHRDLRPHAGVPVDCPGIALPALVAELAGPWNRVEGPEQFSRAGVKRANET